MQIANALAASILLLSSLASAQTTHVVGPGGFAQIRDALAAAATGDIIHVHPGVYAQFSVTTGVTIRALTPGTVAVGFDQSVLPSNCIHNPTCAASNEATSIDIPNGETTNLIGLNFQASTVTGLGTSIQHHVAVRSGTATFADCHIESFHSEALLVTNATVHLANCVISGADLGNTSRGIRGVSANITAIDSEIFGSQVGIGLLPPGEAVLMTNSRFHGCGLLLRGGQTLGNTQGSNAVTASLGSVWISDSALQGGPLSCPIAKTGSMPRLDRVTIIAQTFNCMNVPPSGSLISISQSQPLQIGQWANFNLRTAPSGLLAIYASTDLAAMPIAGFEQPIWLDAANAFNVGFHVAGFLGHSSASVLIPNSPAVMDQAIWFQAVGTTTWPFASTLQVSPIAGGVIR